MVVTLRWERFMIGQSSLRGILRCCTPGVERVRLLRPDRGFQPAAACCGVDARKVPTRVAQSYTLRTKVRAPDRGFQPAAACCGVDVRKVPTRVAQSYTLRTKVRAPDRGFQPLYEQAMS